MTVFNIITIQLAIYYLWYYNVPPEVIVKTFILINLPVVNLKLPLSQVIIRFIG